MKGTERSQLEMIRNQHPFKEDERERKREQGRKQSEREN
jgi:hypothetical protein